MQARSVGIICIDGIIYEEKKGGRGEEGGRRGKEKGKEKKKDLRSSQRGVSSTFAKIDMKIYVSSLLQRQ